MSTPLPADELLLFWVKGSHIQAVVLLFGNCWWPSSPSGPSGSPCGYRHHSVPWQTVLLPLCSAGCLLPLCHPHSLTPAALLSPTEKVHCTVTVHHLESNSHLFYPTSLRVVSSGASYGRQPLHLSPRPCPTAADGLHSPLHPGLFSPLS